VLEGGSMFREIKSLLAPAEVARMRNLAETMQFVDGRVSNQTNPTKNNLQAARGADLRYAESVKIVTDGLARSREFREFAFPKRLSEPLLSRYDIGMSYGAHPDSPYLPVAPSGLLRTDLSATIFISDPESYDGGELVVYLGNRQLSFKGSAGDAIVYPSTKLHEVSKVTGGSRLVSIVFIESIIADEYKRTQIYELNEIAALEGAHMSWENRMRFEVARNNLMRMWSES
jgi:PKHD-type hydroxylase